MRPWDGAFESECHRLVVEVCDVALPSARRDAAWRALLTRVAPHVEAWAASSPVLRRTRLAAADEARSVLVGVLSRMNARGFENLRMYLARKPPLSDAEDQEAALVEGLARIAGDGEAVAEAGPRAALRPDEPGGAAAPMPLHAWLRGLTRYAVLDHVKQRLGWTSSVRVRYGLSRGPSAVAPDALEQAVRAVAGVVAADLDAGALALDVAYLPGTARPERIDAAIAAAGFEISEAPDLRRSKRDLVTGAERLDAVAEPAARPPITDAITFGRLLDEVLAHMKSFPAPMADAVRLWLDDEPFDAVAARLGLDGPERARALVRAGLARLRERFRDRWPALFEG